MAMRTTSTSVSGEIQFYQIIEPMAEDEKIAITVCISGEFALAQITLVPGCALRNWSALHEPLECLQRFSFWPNGFQ